MHGAAAIIIGNEVLSAKVTDTNGPFLVRKLRERGIPLVSMHVVLDDVDAIVEAIQLARRRARWLFTSGGIGPTHDDVTVRAVALALGRDVVRLPEMEALLRQYYQGREMPPEALRLAEAPRGGRVVNSPHSKYPVLAVDDVFMLPGVPSHFEAQVQAVIDTLPRGQFSLQIMYLSAGETEIASVLDRVAQEAPDVAIGSYPTVAETDWRVRLTVEHESPARVSEVVAKLAKALPQNSVLRTESVAKP